MPAWVWITVFFVLVGVVAFEPSYGRIARLIRRIRDL